MIFHVMLIDKKLVATLPAIDLLNDSTLRLAFRSACVAACFWDTISTRSPVFQRRPVNQSAEQMPALPFSRPANSESPLSRRQVNFHAGNCGGVDWEKAFSRLDCR